MLQPRDRDLLFSLSAILVNRLVLNLRKVGNEDKDNMSTISQVGFATNRFLDNIGAPLRNGSEDSDFDDDVEEFGFEEYVLLLAFLLLLLNRKYSRFSPADTSAKLVRTLPPEGSNCGAVFVQN